MESRSEHLAWCKQRALAYLAPPPDLPHPGWLVLEAKPEQLRDALASFLSDMSKHEGTRDHPALGLGLLELMLPTGHKTQRLKQWIEGFN